MRRWDVHTMLCLHVPKDPPPPQRRARPETSHGHAERLPAGKAEHQWLPGSHSLSGELGFRIHTNSVTGRKQYCTTRVYWLQRSRVTRGLARETGTSWPRSAKPRVSATSLAGASATICRRKQPKSDHVQILHSTNMNTYYIVGCVDAWTGACQYQYRAATPTVTPPRSTS
ncbi:hypothetical protein LX32DRAFT_436812 [Colletotrichum zoysiae]|uniref:Uncharacterized protein n=1 Tax=Colletotrichum zoysiae TaxID=1216348 RepID=A0AAD9HEK9_9PEZI|nr:hypothetical protein LX32DRAFT_436812 [Colletotrichum zoysiae]